MALTVAGTGPAQGQDLHGKRLKRCTGRWACRARDPTISGSGRPFARRNRHSKVEGEFHNEGENFTIPQNSFAKGEQEFRRSGPEAEDKAPAKY